MISLVEAGGGVHQHQSADVYRQTQRQQELIPLREHASEFTDDEQAILRALEDGALVTDALISRTGLPARRVTATLTVLTIRDLVRQLPGGYFEAVVKLI